MITSFIKRSQILGTHVHADFTNCDSLHPFMIGLLRYLSTYPYHTAFLLHIHVIWHSFQHSMLHIIRAQRMFIWLRQMRPISGPNLFLMELQSNSWFFFSLYLSLSFIAALSNYRYQKHRGLSYINRLICCLKKFAASFVVKFIRTSGSSEKQKKC